MIIREVKQNNMKVYTIKDADGKLYPKAFLSIPTLSKTIVDGQIVDIDYGLDEAIEYAKKSKGQFNLAVCDLLEVANSETK